MLSLTGIIMITIQQIVTLVTDLVEKTRALAADKVTIAQQLADATSQLLTATETIATLTTEIQTLKDDDAVEDAGYEQTIADLKAQVDATSSAAAEAATAAAASESDLTKAVEDANGLLAATPNAATAA